MMNEKDRMYIFEELKKIQRSLGVVRHEIRCNMEEPDNDLDSRLFEMQKELSKIRHDRRYIPEEVLSEILEEYIED